MNCVLHDLNKKGQINSMYATHFKFGIVMQEFAGNTQTTPKNQLSDVLSHTIKKLKHIQGTMNTKQSLSNTFRDLNTDTIVAGIKIVVNGKIKEVKTSGSKTTIHINLENELTKALAKYKNTPHININIDLQKWFSDDINEQRDYRNSLIEPLSKAAIESYQQSTGHGEFESVMKQHLDHTISTFEQIQSLNSNQLSKELIIETFGMFLEQDEL